ncbi:MAG: tyrosyl-tRNA synthetase [Chlamydiota bacterium]|jgi:tyrosyl-tRNA synthetase|nr:tyrosyl-tRNA synthetase [Chlamydiota bacterium]
MIIEHLQKRGLLEATTSYKLINLLQKPTKVYLGFDPTADSLHIGNLVGIIVLRWFQKFGHIPVVVLGGATARIGDPSGKSTERPLLDAQTIATNMNSIIKNFEQVLDFSNSSTRPLIFNNDQWFKEYASINFLRDVGKYFRLGPMLAKDSIKTRLVSKEGISFTEFSYQLLQAYDFYRLYTDHNVQVQLGGSDQWGNITAGIDFIRKKISAQVFGYTFPLLTRNDGRKFGKTEQGTIWLSKDKCSAYQFYQYFYRIQDTEVIHLMRMLTFMELEEIAQYEQVIKSSEYVPNTAQKRLAEEMTRLVHGNSGLQIAQKVTQCLAPGGKAILEFDVLKEISANDMPIEYVKQSELIGQKYIDVSVKVGLVSSKSEAIRLISNNGAYLNNQKIHDINFLIEPGMAIEDRFLVFGSGKRKKILVSIKK